MTSTTTRRRVSPALAQPLCLRRTVLRPLCIRAVLARYVMARVADRVDVRIELPDASTLGTQPPRGEAATRPGLPVIQILRPVDLFERLAHHPKVGIGEAYMAGDWRAGPGTDLADALRPFADRMTTAIPPPLLRWRAVVDRAVPSVQRNSRSGSRRNIAAHYDLGNDVFEAFLDDTLTYSSALFDDSTPWPEQDLSVAQLRKVHAALDLAGVTRGSRVLEIGTGWGTLAIEAAKRGAVVTTCTLSKEQARLARQRAQAAGVASSVDIRLADYRDMTGSYDAVLSVEMIEAVGEEYWPAYLQVIESCLAPGGTAVIQSILMSHERLLATRNSYSWIHKHIFPGGLIPSVRAIEQAADTTSLRVREVNRFGLHYAHTLHRWRNRFLGNWDQIATAGFDDIFKRKWEFYLAYCEAGFASGYLDVAQLRLTRDEVTW